MILHLNKSVYRNIFVFLLSFICMEIGLPQSIKPRSALAQNVSADSLCYWQTANGRSIDLGALCGSKSNQNLPSISFTNRQNLTIDRVKIISENIGKKRYFYVIGTITNSGNVSQRFVKVFYQSYKQLDGSLKLNESNKIAVDEIILQPGETTIFKDELQRRPTLLMLNSLESVEEGSIPVNICYANSVEQEELCKRLSPSAVRRLN
ncbi:MAG: hypothetical protein RM347_001550 [Nostoc sp. ChiQUE02]|uniref:hypothetical protein n=1 Tax=Nostoc sp. ChiQUE02 TaxID=3075377 RepID=UPI003D161F28